MNQKQKDFIEHYLRTGNATESAKRSGYSNKTAYAIGSRLLKNVEVVAELTKRGQMVAQKTDIDVSELLSELRTISRTGDKWHRLRAYDMLLKASGGYVNELALLQKLDDSSLEALAEKMMTKIKKHEG